MSPSKVYEYMVIVIIKHLEKEFEKKQQALQNKKGILKKL